MPVPAQNIIYRNYINKYNLHFKLSVNELFFPECYLQLFSLLEELDRLKGVLMCSIFMLPRDFKLRQKVYKRFLKSDCELHFVLESLIIKNVSDVEEVEQIFKIKRLTDDNSIINKISIFTNENKIY